MNTNIREQRIQQIKDLANWIVFWTKRYEEGVVSARFLEMQAKWDMREIERYLADVTKN